MIQVTTLALLLWATSALAQLQNPNVVDLGNGVHVPGSSPCQLCVYFLQLTIRLPIGQIPANLFEPLQPRLAFAGPTGMTVSWSTFVPIANPQVSCEYRVSLSSYVTHAVGEIDGLSPDALNTVIDASEPSTTYNTSRTWNNHVKITGLQPATKYYYKVYVQFLVLGGFSSMES